jgi:hypothetical protein
LVVRDKEGKPYSVRYDQVNVMLLNEFLKEHHQAQQQRRRIKKQEVAISDLRSKLSAQEMQIDALTVGLQKVNAQIGEGVLGAKVIVSEQATGRKRN